MSACPDCPRYGNPTFKGPRQADCCMEKMRAPSLDQQMALLEERNQAAELAASRTPNNRAARRRAAKLAR